MNYGVKATKKRIRAANSRKKKYANRLFLTFFKTAFVLVLFLCVTGVSTFIGMFKGILDSSPDFNPDSFTPSGYFSTIYNSAGEVTDTLVGSNSNRIEASYEDFPQDLIRRIRLHRGLAFLAAQRYRSALHFTRRGRCPDK